MRAWAPAGALALAALPSLAHADVVALSDNGFVVRHSVEVDVVPAGVWARLVSPASWWNSEHTFSGDAANLTLDARAGGCFCEVLPARDGANEPRGGVEHMRVVYVEADRALRMSGGLGPLQSEGVGAALTMTLKPLDGGGTRVVWEYVVGGYLRYKTGQIAPAVDKVLGEQMARFASELGPRAAAVIPAAAPTEPAPAKPIEGR